MGKARRGGIIRLCTCTGKAHNTHAGGTNIQRISYKRQSKEQREENQENEGHRMISTQALITPNVSSLQRTHHLTVPSRQTQTTPYASTHNRTDHHTSYHPTADV